MNDDTLDPTDTAVTLSGGDDPAAPVDDAPEPGAGDADGSDALAGAAGAGPPPAAPGGDASSRRPSVTIRLERFEGPLDLLLHLIKRDEIDIYDIPIAHITQQYLAYLDLMRALDLDVAGEFLVMAATLMRIKSRMLLPLPPKDDDEAEGDPREELVQRLIEYRQFKEAASTLKVHEDERRLLFERGMVPGDDEVGLLPLAPATLFDLLDALHRVMSRTAEPAVYEVQSAVYEVDDKMTLIRGLLDRQGTLSFFEVLERCRVRAEMIVTFIALLELIKLGQIAVVQAERFGDVTIVARNEEGGEAHAAVESAGDD